MKILVLGAGAIGTMLGGRLAHSGQNVTFFDRQEVTSRIQSGDLRIGWGEIEIVVPNVRCVADLGCLLEEERFEFALLCVKSYDTREILARIPPDIFHYIATFQNGIGNEEILAERFGAEHVLAGAITLPVAVRGLGDIQITNPKGGIGLSFLSPTAGLRDFPGILAQAGFEVRVYNDYRALKWSKLLLNILGNATSAILGISTPEVFRSRRLVRLEREAFLEGLAVMRALKIEPVDLPGYPVRAVARLFRICPPSILKMILSSKMGKGRGEKLPSLLLDLQRQIPKSEVEVLNGAIARKSRDLGLSAPANGVLSGVLMGIVRGEIPWDGYRGRPERLLEVWAREAKE